jgi:hypothetical protein
MNTHADKTQENKSQSVANAVTQKQSGGETTIQFVDNRPEAIAQSKLQEMANNSPQAKQAVQLQAMADNHSGQKKQIIQKKDNNTGLPDNLKSGMENLSGHSMDDVKVHYNSDKPAQLQAHAYAQGPNIHLGPGQEKHLPHEAWHVVQQKQGRVRPTMQMKGKVNVNDDAGLEKEADIMGAKATQMQLKEISPSAKQLTIANDTYQLARMRVTITGITHLVRPIHGTIFGGKETAQVSHGMELEIDTDHSIWSRRGPNQEQVENRMEDSQSGQKYEWYPVISINEKDAPSNSYLRDETFIAPSELRLGQSLKDEALDGIARANEKNQPGSGKPVEPNYDTIKDPTSKQKAQDSYKSRLATWMKKNQGKSLQELLNIVFQNLGTTFERAAEDFIVRKHPGCTIYDGLSLGSQHELDFVVIQGQDVIIYSAKLDPSKVHPATDLEHWEAIKAGWTKIKGKILSGSAPVAPPRNHPLVLGLSPQTFGLNNIGFLTALVPNWQQKLTV